MKYKYMVMQLEPDTNLDRMLGRLADSGWRLKTHVPIITTGPNKTPVFIGERVILEKADPEGMLDAELEALSTIVRAQLVNHEVQASMAAKHGDYLNFYSPQFEMLLHELRKRGIIE